MPQKIHYQDNIFFLSVLIKALDSGLSTDADPEHFRDNVIGNLEFIGSSLGLFLGFLDQNVLLIDRAEYVKLLERTSRAYTVILEKLLAGSYLVASAYSSLRPRLVELQRAQQITHSKIDDLLSSTLGAEAGSDLVSEDELSELLRE
jgi:hypothetical protein